MSRRKESAPIPSEEIPERQGVTDTLKKKRPSKKEVTSYKFSEEQHRTLAEFVREHPALCNKQCREWSNPAITEALWRELALQFPNCTWQQCRKFYEAKRTDFGKIAKKKKKNGSAARPLTAREELMMEIWGFLADHIAHEKTETSERFMSGRMSSASSESSLSAHSAHSLAMKRKTSVSRQESAASSSSAVLNPGFDPTIIADILKEEQNFSSMSVKPCYPAGVQEFANFTASRLVKIPEHLHGDLYTQILAMVESKIPPPQQTPGQLHHPTPAPAQIRDTARTKWKGLRDYYRKELKLFSGENNGQEDGEENETSQWPYFQAMSFLRDALNLPPPKLNTSRNDNKASKHQEPNENEIFVKEEEEFDDVVERPREVSNSREASPQPSQNSLTSKQKFDCLSDVQIANHKRMKSESDYREAIQQFESQKLKLLQREAMESDEDWMFLKSLLPDIKGLTKSRKMFVKLKIQELLYNENVTKDDLPSSSPTSNS